MDDLEYNGFVENGVVVKDGYQSEFAILIRIPTSESGLATETLFLYYHNIGDPTNTISQETHLLTSVGGELHTATWTQRGTVLGVESGDNHTGYLRIWKRGVGDYIGNHLRLSGGVTPFIDHQQISTSSDGLNWTRGVKYSVDLNMPSGGTFWRHDIQPFEKDGTLYGFVTYTNTIRYLALVELEPTTYLPKTFIKTIIQQTFTDQTIFIENNVAYIYLRNKDFINADMPEVNSLYLYKYDLTETI